jgi:hypothetical protein
MLEESKNISDESSGIIVEATKLMKKSELMQWAKEHIDTADKCLMVFAYRKPEGGMDVAVSQVGFQYIYELDGFVQMLPEMFIGEET